MSLYLTKELLAIVAAEGGRIILLGSLAFGRLPMIDGWSTPIDIWAAPFGYLRNKEHDVKLGLDCVGVRIGVWKWKMEVISLHFTVYIMKFSKSKLK